MKSLADALPPEITRQISPEWRKNEAEYWAVRDQLLSQYQGQWIAFSSDGCRIIAAAESLERLEELLEAVGEDPRQLVLEGLPGPGDEMPLGAKERRCCPLALPLLH